MPEDLNDSGNTSVDAATIRAALDGLRETLARMTPETILRPAGLDPAGAARIVIGSLPRISAQRDAVVARFGEEGARMLDAVPIAAYAVTQAGFELKSALDDADLREMHAKVLADHTLLITDADALVNRNLLERGRVDACRSTQGYQTTVESTGGLLALLEQSWSSISGKTPLTTADLQKVAANLKEMVRRLNEREQGTNRVPAIEMRARALSHLVTVYSEVRRMITFVRWHEGDADSIAPSLYAFRKRGKNASAEPEVDGDNPVLPGPGAPPPVVPPVTPSSFPR